MAAIHHLISPFRKREMKEGFSQRTGVRFNQHFFKNKKSGFAAKLDYIISAESLRFNQYGEC
jgi:hypothetical protein